MSNSGQPSQVATEVQGLQGGGVIAKADVGIYHHNPVAVMSDEKKQADSMEEAGTAITQRSMEQPYESNQVHMLADAISPTMLADVISPTEGSNTTFSGLHSSPPAQVAAAGTKSTMIRAAPAEKPHNPVVATDAESPMPPNNQAAMQAPHSNDEEEDSSNDDSSYFADPTNLPSPGEAGRKYSFSSHHSTNKSTAKGRESDASLSLSEDSEEENHQVHHPTVPYRQRGEAPEVFPAQRITRMHSVGSLVSTSSQNSDEDMAIPRDHRHVGREHEFENHNNARSGRVALGQGPHAMYPSDGQHQQYPHDHSPPSMVPDNLLYQAPQSFRHQNAVIGQEQWLRNEYNMQNSSGSASEVSVHHYNDPGGMPRNGSAFYPHSGSGGNYSIMPTSNRLAPSDVKQATSGGPDEAPKEDPPPQDIHGDDNFKVYWQRWIMLMYISILNLLVSTFWYCAITHVS